MHSHNAGRIEPVSLAIVGCGDLGLRLAGLLPDAWRVTGLRRDPRALPPRIAGLAADYGNAGDLAVLAGLAPDYLITTLKPIGRDVAGYWRGFADATRHVLGGLGEHRPRAIFMVSSTRVYGEQDGGWVEEDSPLSRDDDAAGAIIDAEQQLIGSPHRGVLLRCGGIYGEPGGRLLERVVCGRICPSQPLRYSNRVHRDDVAGLLWHLLQQAECGEPLAPVYNVVDDCPAPQHEVEQWLAEALGVTASAVAAPVSAGHKRCRNRALHASGYHLRYPDYRAGYRAVLRQRAPG
jgi:nucleoside-diphosphate-sugar epimerase